jgi:hypothetical protein
MKKMEKYIILTDNEKVIGPITKAELKANYRIEYNTGIIIESEGKIRKAGEIENLKDLLGKKPGENKLRKYMTIFLIIVAVFFFKKLDLDLDNISGGLLAFIILSKIF